MENTVEEWRWLLGFKDRVQVSNLGRVRTLRILEGSITSHGYVTVAKNYEDWEGIRARPGKEYVHALVARTFKGTRPDGMEVNHIDGDRSNNAEENLEYITPKGNQQHAFKIGNRNHYFTDSQMDQISQWYFIEGIDQTEIARKLITDRNNVAEMRRMRKKVRSVCEIWRKKDGVGKRKPKRKQLTVLEVARMRELYAAGKLTQTELGKMFECHPANVSRVVRGLLHPNGNASVTLD